MPIGIKSCHEHDDLSLLTTSNTRQQLQDSEKSLSTFADLAGAAVAEHMPDSHDKMSAMIDRIISLGKAELFADFQSLKDLASKQFSTKVKSTWTSHNISYLQIVFFFVNLVSHLDDTEVDPFFPMSILWY